MITDELNANLGDQWIHHNSHMTAAGLRDALRDAPNRIHFLEDMEPLLRDRDAAGILRSACGSVKGGGRTITSTTARQQIRFDFTGGIIIASNESLSKHGILGAVASRMKPMHWMLSQDEIKAVINDAVEKGIECGGQRLDPKEAAHVRDFVFSLMDEGYEIDLRSFFDHAVPSYLHWKHENGVCELQQKLERLNLPQQSDDKIVHWQDVVRSKLAGEATVESRDQRLARERAIACDCHKAAESIADRLRLWEEKTGYKKQAFYNRIKEAKASGLF
ncbi:hypothetical protein [Planctomycetes bacterium SV_7m_r]